MNILMLYPNCTMPCDGFRLLASLLRREGHDVKIVTTIIYNPLEDIPEDDLHILGDFSMACDLVMISVYSLYESHAISLTTYLKKLRPERLVIWGGPHCINAPERSLKFAEGVSYSEGDIAVPQFVRLLESGNQAYLQTPNMAFQNKGSIIINPLLPLLDDLDALPFYDYSFEDEWILNKSLIRVTKEIFSDFCSKFPFKSPTISFISMRGCVYNCSYCNNNRYLALYPKNKIRKQSVGRMIAELKYVTSQLHNIPYVFIIDDDFFIRSQDEIHEFVTLYNMEINLPLAICISANKFTKSKFDEIRHIDNLIIVMGVQSGSQKVLDNIYNRPIPLTKVKNVIEEILPFLKNGNLKLICDFMIDNPYETESDVMETYKFIVRMDKKINISVFLINFFPGTKLFERALQDKIITEKDNLIRQFISREIKYQINFPMLLLLFWDHNRRIPSWIMLLPTIAPVRFLMIFMPHRIIAWAIRNIQTSGIHK